MELPPVDSFYYEAVKFRSHLVLLCGQLRRRGFKPELKLPSAATQGPCMLNYVNSLRFERFPNRKKLRDLLMIFSAIETMLIVDDQHGLSEEDHDILLTSTSLPIFIITRLLMIEN